MKSLNVPVTRQEMEDFKESGATRIGGKTQTGRDNDGNPIYYPNRRERKQFERSKNQLFSIKNNRKGTRGRMPVSERSLNKKLTDYLKAIKADESLVGKFSKFINNILNIKRNAKTSRK